MPDAYLAYQVVTEDSRTHDLSLGEPRRIDSLDDMMSLSGDFVIKPAEGQGCWMDAQHLSFKWASPDKLHLVHNEGE